MLAGSRDKSGNKRRRGKTKEKGCVEGSVAQEASAGEVSLGNAPQRNEHAVIVIIIIFFSPGRGRKSGWVRISHEIIVWIGKYVGCMHVVCEGVRARARACVIRTRCTGKHVEDRDGYWS